MSNTLVILFVGPPTIKDAPTEVMAKKGEKVSLRVTVSGSPQPESDWYKDDDPVEESSRVKITEGADYTALEISDVRPEDGGVYTCAISNAGGEDECDIKLTIEG